MCAVDALAFLEKAAKSKLLPMYALFGEEDFLKRMCRDAIIARAVGDSDPEFAVTNFPGDKLDYTTVRNELSTMPFLCPMRVLVIDQADSFVSAHRESLEKYIANPSKIGVLILDVKTFPETTKLAKAMPEGAKIVCKSPTENKLTQWCGTWTKSAHAKTITSDAVGMLIGLIGPQMGLLAQELAKLAVAVGVRTEIDANDVDTFVARNRTANVFGIMDAVGEGHPAVALGILVELLDSGEEPLKLMGALTFQLRKLASVARLTRDGLSLGPAMDSAGVAKWPQARQSTERQLRHLGRKRLSQLSDMLVEINLGLKGGSPLPSRLQVERLIVRLARPNEAATTKSRLS